MTCDFNYSVEIFFRCNQYFVECEERVEDFFSRDVLWLPKVLDEIFVDAETFRSNLISLFDLVGGISHSKTP